MLHTYIEQYSVWWGTDEYHNISDIILLIISDSQDKMIALKTDKHTEDYWEVMNNIDYKFAAIPFAFILIRIWSLTSDILYVYVGESPNDLLEGLVSFLMYALVCD